MDSGNIHRMPALVFTAKSFAPQALFILIVYNCNIIVIKLISISLTKMSSLSFL